MQESDPPPELVQQPAAPVGHAAAMRAIGGALSALLADLFALYVKTKNFQWHNTGPHFRDIYLLLHEQTDEILAAVHPMAERVRAIGGKTIRSISHIARLQRISDNDADHVTQAEMLLELQEDNFRLGSLMRDAHALCHGHQDVASAGLLEKWIGEADRRTWFLLEANAPCNGL